MKWPYVVAAADGHVRVAWGHPFHWAGAGQVVVVNAAGVAGRHGGKGVEGEELVEQTAGQQRAHWLVSVISAHCIPMLGNECTA